MQSDQRWTDCYTNSSCTGSIKHCTGTEWNLVGTDTFYRFKGNYFLFCIPVYLRTQSVKNFKQIVKKKNPADDIFTTSAGSYYLIKFSATPGSYSPMSTSFPLNANP